MDKNATPVTRRRLLAWSAAAGISATAGCAIEVGDYQIEAGESGSAEDPDDADGDDSTGSDDEQGSGRDSDEEETPTDSDEEETPTDSDEEETPTDSDDDDTLEKPEVTFDFDDDEADENALIRRRAPDQEISGTTNLDAGAEVEFVIKEEQGGAELDTRTATVAADGGVSTSFDFSGLAGGEYFLNAHHDGGHAGHADVVVVHEKPTITFDFDDDEADENALFRRRAPDQEVSGTTNLWEGAEVEFVLREEQGGTELDTRTTTVAADGGVSTSFDFSELDGGEYFLNVHHDGGHVGHVQVVVHWVKPTVTFDLDDDEADEYALIRHPAPDQEISGTTNLWEGAEIGFVLRTEQGGTEIESRTGTVTAADDVTVQFDLSGLTTGEYFLNAYHDGGHAGHITVLVETQ